MCLHFERERHTNLCLHDFWKRKKKDCQIRICFWKTSVKGVRGGELFKSGQDSFSQHAVSSAFSLASSVQNKHFPLHIFSFFVPAEGWRMDFDLPPTIPVSGIPWERVLSPLLPRLGGTFGSYSWTPAELLIPVKEHTGAAQVGETSHFLKLKIFPHCQIAKRLYGLH